MQTTRTGKRTATYPTQFVEEANGDISFYIHGSTKRARVFHIKADGTLTQGNMRRLQAVFK